MLLESSNAETWTPLNGSDLTVKIYGYDFQPSGEVRFQPVTGAQFSELNLDEYSAIPEGTGIVWEYSTDGGTTWDAIVPAEEENLPNIASDVLLRALFESTAINDSPALNYKDVNLIGHLNNMTGAYISRENELTQGVESTKVYTQMNIPSGTSLNWFTSNDDGATWEPMSIASTREIDQEWTEYTLTRTFSDPSSKDATRPASPLTLTAPCFFTARHAMKVPTGPLFRVSGHLRSAGRTCSGPIIWVRDSRPADRFAAVKAPRPNGTWPSPTRPWETSGSTPTFPAVESGRNMPEPHGNGPDQKLLPPPKNLPSVN